MIATVWHKQLGEFHAVSPPWNLNSLGRTWLPDSPAGQSQLVHSETQLENSYTVVNWPRSQKFKKCLAKIAQKWLIGTSTHNPSKPLWLMVKTRGSNVDCPINQPCESPSVHCMLGSLQWLPRVGHRVGGPDGVPWDNKYPPMVSTLGFSASNGKGRVAMTAIRSDYHHSWLQAIHLDHWPSSVSAFTNVSIICQHR